jgi:ribosome-associated protein
MLLATRGSLGSHPGKDGRKSPSHLALRQRNATEELNLTRTATGTKKTPRAPKPKRAAAADKALLTRILTSLDDDKAEDIVTIDLDGRSSLADALVIANGRSQRHVSAIAEHLARRLKEAGYGTRPIDGLSSGDWVLVDAGDIIVHIFRPEVRNYYDLEGMWSVEEPKRANSR